MPDKRSLHEFLQRKSEELQRVNGGYPEIAAGAVLAQLKARIGEQPGKHLQHGLPADLPALVEVA